ncbi:MAG TPA: response regulator [Holophaga sp.]|nr:response regulator [Holophaga sp.]
MAEKPLALVVDDTEIHRSLIKMTLTAKGYLVTTAMDGQEGFDLCKKNNYTLVFSDFEMPNMNGAEFLRAVKRLPAYRDVPVVILSTLEDPDVKQRVMSLGAFHYIVKPFNQAKLDELFKRLA